MSSFRWANKIKQWKKLSNKGVVGTDKLKWSVTNNELTYKLKCIKFNQRFKETFEVVLFQLNINWTRFNKCIDQQRVQDADNQ